MKLSLLMISLFILSMLVFGKPDVNRGVDEMGRLSAFAQVCYKDKIMPLGEWYAVRRHAARNGYNGGDPRQVEEASRIEKKIIDRVSGDPDRTRDMCRGFQSHVDLVLFGPDYKPGYERWK